MIPPLSNSSLVNFCHYMYNEIVRTAPDGLSGE